MAGQSWIFRIERLAKLRVTAYFKWVGVPCIAAFLILACADQLASVIPWVDQDHPSLPTVTIPEGKGGDFLSTIPGLFVALTMGGLAMLVAEIGKFGALKLREPRLFWLVGVYQCVLLFDTLRVGAHDWWLYSLHWVGIVDLHVHHEWSVDSLPPPWIALVALFVLLALTHLESRRTAGREGDTL